MPERHEVVISGIGGIFPECDSVEELRKKLFEKVDLVTTDDRRWLPGSLGVPSAIGKVTGSDYFDANFFGIHRKVCESLDPLTRLLMERAYEAIVDSGVNPTELNGSNTAVIMASCISETETYCIQQKSSKAYKFIVLGHNRAMLANRVSYFLNLNGPSFGINCTWTGGMQCLQQAFNMVADGSCNAALVGVSNLTRFPSISLQYIGLGNLSYDGRTKSFSADADGYARSEATVVFFLQKKQDARRSYGSIVNVGCTNIGERLGTFNQTPTSEVIKSFLEDCYKEAKIDPSDISYLEAEGCAVPAMDEFELNVCDEVICKHRKKPLLVGSIKSNLGHTEASSCLVSIVKALIAMDLEIIPPNLYYSSPNPGVPGLIEDRLKVVTEATPLEGDLVAINSFDFTGSFSHVILKKNPTKKVKPVLQDKFSDGLPRLFMASARNAEGMNKILDKVENSSLDEEFFYLSNNVFAKDIQGHLFRGFTVVPKTKTSHSDSMEVAGGKQRPIWFIFSGMGSQWTGMGRSLMQFPIFAAAIQKCQNVLKSRGVDIINIITSNDPSIFDNILNCFVGIAAVQIGLVDMLFAMGIKPDGILGHSVGELGCAYADGCFTAEEMILCALARGRASLETNLIKGMMAAVGLGYQQIKDELPDTIEVACHNSANSCTLSGPAEDMEVYIQQLKDRKVFAKLVNVANIAYHSRYIAPAAPVLLKYLKEVIKEPKERSAKWISSSVPEKDWDTPIAKSSSPEYHKNNLMNPVLFEEASKHIGKDSICIEIAPHGLLQAILKGMSVSGITNIPLTLRTQEDGVRFYLESVGKMYLNGLLPDVKQLYPSVEFRTSRGTQTLSDLVTWDHTEMWSMVDNSDIVELSPRLRTIKIDFNDVQFNFLLDQKLNDRFIFPGSASLYFAWETLMYMAKEFTSDKTVIFENIRFHEIAVIGKSKTVAEGNILLQSGSGDWEILIDDKIAATGSIREAHEVDDNLEDYFPEDGSAGFRETPKDVVFEKKDVYEVLKNVGFSLKNGFEIIQSVVLSDSGLKGSVVFPDNWSQFLDAVMKLSTFGKIDAENELYMPTAIQKLIIRASKIEPGQAVDLVMDYYTNVITSPVIKIFGIKSEHVTVNPTSDMTMRLEEYRFVPYFNSSIEDFDQLFTVCMQLSIENSCLNWKDDDYELSVVVLDDKNKINHLIPRIERSVHGKSNVQIKILPASTSLEGLLESEFGKPSSMLILTAETSLNKAMEILKKHEDSFILAFASTQYDPIQKADCQVLYRQKVGIDNIVLLKKTVKHETRSWSVILASNPNWLSELALLESSTFQSHSNHAIYIVIDVEQHMGIPEFIRTVERSYTYCNQIRYFILHDTECPKFSPTLPFYYEQISLDFQINVYKDGNWGSFRKFRLTDDVSPVLESTSSFTALSTLSNDEIDLHYLGFNYKDFSVLPSDSSLHELGHLDYSGVNSKGERIMGISPHYVGMAKLSPDPILKWRIPNSWSFEEAASVPLAYTMAYYSLIEIARLLPQQSVLIHCGYTQIGLAALSIAVKKKCKIFTTYSHKDQVNLILEKFPTINSEHLFEENSNFNIDIILKTKGSGVDVVLNFNERKMSSSLECLSQYGRFLHLGQNKKELKSSIGMRVFLKATSVSGVNGNYLFDYPDNIKEKLRTMVQSGIEDGTVKPFERIVAQGSCTDKDASELMRSTIVTESWKKVELCIKPENSKKSFNSVVNKFSCNPNRSYIVVGGETSLFLDIATWLVKRGARKLVIVVSQQGLNTVSIRRLDILTSKYNDLVIQKIPADQITSVKTAENLISNVISFGPVDGIFFVALTDGNEIMNYLDKASRKLCPNLSVFLSLFSESGKICDSRREARLPAIALHREKPTQHIALILYALDTVINKKDICLILMTDCSSDLAFDDEKSSLRHLSWHLPNSIDELLAFGKELSPIAKFEEIITLSPKFSGTKGMPPVFIIPSFKPNLFDGLISKLVYPAFVAKLPAEISSLDDIATDLVKDLRRIRSFECYTFLASGWGGILALKLVSLLEKEEKLATVILIDAHPQSVQKWTTFFKDDLELKLINRYFTLTNEEQIKLKRLKDWSHCLDGLSDDVLKRFDNSKEIKHALNTLRNRLLLLDYKESDLLKNVILLCYEPSEPGSVKNYSGTLCKNAITLVVSEKTDLQSMINDEKFIKDVNSHVQFEYPGSVNKPDLIKTLSSLAQAFST